MNDTQNSAPYAPAEKVTLIIEGYRNRGLQTPFNLDILQKAGVQKSLAPRTLQSLHLLNLIDDDGNPTDQLEMLRTAPEDEYRERFSEVLKAVYSDIFAFADPSVDGYERVRDAFRNHVPRGQQERMVSLFLNLCQYAEIIQAIPRKKAQKGSDRKKQVSRTPIKAKPKKVESKEGLSSALVGLLDRIPRGGDGWTKKEREKFIEVFSTILDYDVPTIPEEKDNEGKSSDDTSE